MELVKLEDVLTICSAYCPDDDGSCSKAGHDLREMLDEIEALPIVHIDDMAFNIQNEIQAKKPERTVEITFVRHGRWIEESPNEYYCSYCGKYAPIEKNMRHCDCSNWCKECGTKMDALQHDKSY